MNGRDMVLYFWLTLSAVPLLWWLWRVWHEMRRRARARKAFKR